MFKFSVPSKTFLIGEYAVLQGSSGILVGTFPRFEAKIKKVEVQENGFIEGLSPQGPSMDFLKDNIDVFSSYSIMFHDPHEGKGGLGWSSAQFIMLYALREWIRNGQVLPDINPKALLEEYLKYSWNGQGWAPSGLDVLCQLQGGILQVTAPKKYQDSKLLSVLIEEYHHYKDWPFQDISFCLLRTGTKVATHAHLSGLNSINFGELARFSLLTGESLKVKDEELFLDCINQFRESLINQHLVDPNSVKLYSLLQERPEVLAYKGCGALGADVILVINVRELMSDFMDWARENDFDIIATSEDVSRGLTVEELMESDDLDLAEEKA
jgi:hypothetical protein